MEEHNELSQQQKTPTKKMFLTVWMENTPVWAEQLKKGVNCVNKQKYCWVRRSDLRWCNFVSWRLTGRPRVMSWSKMLDGLVLSAQRSNWLISSSKFVCFIIQLSRNFLSHEANTENLFLMSTLKHTDSTFIALLFPLIQALTPWPWLPGEAVVSLWLTFYGQ